MCWYTQRSGYRVGSCCFAINTLLSNLRSKDKLEKEWMAGAVGGREEHRWAPLIFAGALWYAYLDGLMSGWCCHCLHHHDGAKAPTCGNTAFQASIYILNVQIIFMATGNVPKATTCAYITRKPDKNPLIYGANRVMQGCRWAGGSVSSAAFWMLW